MIFRQKMKAVNCKNQKFFRKQQTYRHGKKGRDGVPFSNFFAECFAIPTPELGRSRSLQGKKKMLV